MFFLLLPYTRHCLNSVISVMLKKLNDMYSNFWSMHVLPCYCSCFGSNNEQSFPNLSRKGPSWMTLVIVAAYLWTSALVCTTARLTNLANPTRRPVRLGDNYILFFIQFFPVEAALWSWLNLILAARVLRASGGAMTPTVLVSALYWVAHTSPPLMIRYTLSMGTALTFSQR